jgi:hypothetical protein
MQLLQPRRTGQAAEDTPLQPGNPVDWSAALAATSDWPSC